MRFLKRFIYEDLGLTKIDLYKMIPEGVVFTAFLILFIIFLTGFAR